MEERKRPASYDNDDPVPPLKRQATSAANAASKNHQDDLPGRDDLEKFQKEAILRQMQEYKREKNTLEGRLNDLTKSAAYHDDHLRLIDAWFDQLLDEIKLLVGKVDDKTSFSTFPSKLLNADVPSFEKHLGSRSQAISCAIERIFTQGTKSVPGISDLQERIAQLLAAEKDHVSRLEKMRLEKEQIEDRLEHASMRYMMAEKKYDRAKSATVAKLEQQAIASGRSENGIAGDNDGTDTANGVIITSENLIQAETARKEALAASAKRKEQLDQLTAENEKLTAQISTMTIKMSHLSDEDYANTDLFKHLKGQYEDVIKRINDLEATNIELRQEAQLLQAERSAYRAQMDAEAQAAITEKELQLLKAEADLARIRTARDELQADLAVRKATLDQERASVNQVKQLAAAREDRIQALESEVQRLAPGESPLPNGETFKEDEATMEELRAKYSTLERQCSMLNTELASMGAAYRKLSATSAQKINNLSELEERVLRLGAEKAKADQKYFGAMKAKDAMEQQIRMLKAQSTKSSDMVSQLKDTDVAGRALLSNLEKQLAEVNGALASLNKQVQKGQSELSDKQKLEKGLKDQVENLKATILSKNTALAAAQASQREAEVEIEKMKVDLEEKDKRLKAATRSKGSGDEVGQVEMLRALALCTVCRQDFKDTVIKTCGHVLCKKCIDERITSRSRKCPHCNRAFGAGDTMKITLN